VEAYLDKSPYIKECMVFGKEIEGEIEPKVCAMIVPDKDEISKFLKKDELSTEEIHKFIEAEVKKANKQMPMYKMVREFEIRDQEFEKTTTQKIKRKMKR
jgi:long-chain acyl-CoA synthetase